jgi:hypothetical protein
MVSFGYYDPEHHGAICRETYGPRTTCYPNALVDLEQIPVNFTHSQRA